MSSSRKRPSVQPPPKSTGAGDNSGTAGGSKWAPIVVFGGIVAIGLTSVVIVLASNCNRDQPYLDPVKLRYNPNEVKPIPKPERARRGKLKAPLTKEKTPLTKEHAPRTNETAPLTKEKAPL